MNGATTTREDEEVCEKGGGGMYEWGIKMQSSLTQEGKKKGRCEEWSSETTEEAESSLEDRSSSRESLEPMLWKMLKK